MSDCCGGSKPEEPKPTVPPCCAGENPEGRKKTDLLFWVGFFVILSALVVVAFGHHLSFIPTGVSALAREIIEIISQMWWGLVIGILAVGILEFVPMSLLQGWLGRKANANGLLRALVAGILLDVCSHGVLLISMQLYRKGLSLGQTIAFLVASPWNSISLTFVLWSLIGWKWTALFVILSMIVALLTGYLYSLAVRRNWLPENPNNWEQEPFSDKEESFTTNLRNQFAGQGITGIATFIRRTLLSSQSILRWIFLGILLAALIRVWVEPASFSHWFGPALSGLGLTLLVATILEVCSEGSSPIAADLLQRAHAPGNAFAFLMAGVATDYTEIAILRETTKSWSIALLLPAITVPQIMIIAWFLNQ